MSDWWLSLLVDLYLSDFYRFCGALLSPEKLHQHIETALTSWPLAIVIIAFGFRGQFAKLLATIRSLSYKDGSRVLTASWGEAVEELKEIEKLTEQQAPLPGPAQNGDFDKLAALAKVSRRSAIIEAWLNVETAAQDLVEPYLQGTSIKGSAMAIERELWRRELIGPNEREIFAKLRSLRNQASHLKDFQITNDEAVAYIDTALSLAARLRFIKENQ